jgi:hypothetical protein
MAGSSYAGTGRIASLIGSRYLYSKRALEQKGFFMQHDPYRRAMLAALPLGTFAVVLRTAPVGAQTTRAAPALKQPAEKTKAAFLARARELRDEAVREGDQAYGAVVVRNGIIVGEGRNYVVLQNDPTPRARLMRGSRRS